MHARPRSAPSSACLCPPRCTADTVMLRMHSHVPAIALYDVRHSRPSRSQMPRQDTTAGSTCYRACTACLLRTVMSAECPQHGVASDLCARATQYLCWVELLIAQLLTPNASLLGHLSGILAGLLHVYLLEGLAPGSRGPNGAGWLDRRLRALRNWRRRPFEGVSHQQTTAPGCVVQTPSKAQLPAMLVIRAPWQPWPMAP